MPLAPFFVENGDHFPFEVTKLQWEISLYSDSRSSVASFYL
jgi:hypothetical protein